jgi:thiamine biosynthesis lipoprotein
MSLHDATFEAMGCDVRLVVGDPVERDLPDARTAVADAQSWLADFDARLSRFRPGSELCALNADPRVTVPASPLLRAAVGAAVWAAHASGGLVDPTLLDDVEAVGYTHSLAGVEPASLADALRSAPPRRRAGPHPTERWRAITIDAVAGAITRPPGLRLDSGGAGKGLAADALAHRFARYSRVAIDCAGDVRVSGPGAYDDPFTVEIEHPLTHEAACSLRLCDGAIATSGIGTRIWRTREGFAHHLIDPASGEPAWTGVVQATAIGRSALEAETLSKMALLSGPHGARRILRALGGAIVRDDGEVELIGRLRPRPRAFVQVPEEVAA